MPNWTLITGASKGVGAAAARLLAQQGHSLVLHYRHSKAEIQELARECRQRGAQAETMGGDFSTAVQTSHFLEAYQQRFTPTICLVANVGPYALGSVTESSMAIWRELFEVNFFAPVQIIQTLLPDIKQHQGSIVTLGVAGVGDLRAENYAGAYFTAKRALCSFTRSLAKELAGDGVSANMVSPGRLQGAMDAPKDPKELPMHREGSIEEVARVIAFLLEPASRYITGQNIEVAGGVRL